MDVSEMILGQDSGKVRCEVTGKLLTPLVVRGSEGGTRLENSPCWAMDSTLRLADMMIGFILTM